LSESLTPDQVRAIARLARLDLSDDEVAHLAPQLGAIVGYVALLRQVDTEGVEPLAHALPVQNVFREDEPTDSLPRERALTNAPQQRDGCFTVPAVLE
jgi:aspartyl-tRNA(Asn)/glutamyl-tRNA(Gln) amidotransferase subunit C